MPPDVSCCFALADYQQPAVDLPQNF